MKYFIRILFTVSTIFLFSFLAFAEEKIPVFPNNPVDAYTVYMSLAVFWFAIIGLIAVIKMKLTEIERIQKLGLDKEDPHTHLLE
jgi:hypothetical protein